MKKPFLILLLLALVQLQGLSWYLTENSTRDTVITKSDIEFASSGLKVKGWLFTPANPVNTPLIIMAPGFGLVKECNYSYFAEQFSKAGFAVILFDHLNFGASGSKTRQEVDPGLQIDTYYDAIKYAASFPFIDLKRIGVWGAGFSGGHAIVVSAQDDRIKCFVAMTPFVSGEASKKLQPRTQLEKLENKFLLDKQNRAMGKRPVLIPLVGKSVRAYCAIHSIHAFDFVHSFSTYAPSFQNAVTLKSLEMQFEYEPGSYITKIKKKPMLFLIASNDEMIPESHILDVYQKASGPKHLHYFDGHHYSAFREKRKETCDMAIDFFKKYLN